MYGILKIAFKYLKYYITSDNGKGHGIHSPFVFDLVKNVLNDKSKQESFDRIEKVRKDLLAENRTIDVIDFGAGSGVIKTNNRQIKSIASTSLKPKKYAQLLYRFVKYFNPNNILELGTSLGVTTSYLSSANPSAKLITCEGDPSIASIAKANFEKLGLKNVEQVIGDFNSTLPTVLSQNKNFDFVFIDGNHKRQPTLDYFHLLLENINEDSVLVFDDIHWSEEMEAAWKEIKQNDKVRLSIDLFFIGLVFFKSAFHHKQDFVVRF